MTATRFTSGAAHGAATHLPAARDSLAGGPGGTEVSARSAPGAGHDRPVTGAASAAPIKQLPNPPAQAISRRDRFDACVARRLMNAPARLQLRLSGKTQIRLDGQQLDPGIQLTLRALELRGAPTLVGASHGDPDPVVARARVRRGVLMFSDIKTGVGDVRELEMTGADGPLRARHYLPLGSSEGGKPPLLVFFHGGGWVTGDLDTHDEPCRILCRHARIQVLSVDYRLAPEHPFPAGVRDALASFRWAVTHAPDLGADPARVAVGGDSAGGNLSAVTAQLAARDGGPSPALQLLIYPAVDLTATRTTSGQLFADGFYLTDRDRQWCARHYLSGTENDAADPRASPGLTTNLSNLAPAIVITAGFDPLRDEGETYAKALRNAGTPVVHDRAPELIHGFINMTPVPAAREATLRLARTVGASLHRAT